MSLCMLNKSRGPDFTSKESEVRSARLAKHTGLLTEPHQHRSGNRTHSYRSSSYHECAITTSIDLATTQKALQMYG